MSVIAEAGAQAGGAPERPAPDGGSFLGPLVVRLSMEYDVDPETVRSLGAEALASFAGARVQAFVPILVEKRVRQSLRVWRDLGMIVAAPEESAASA